MNNIDILEEFIEAYRVAEEVLDGEIIDAIETLIAKNKELKKENDSLKKEVIHWKGEYHLENRKYLDLYNKKVSIPKINATEEMLEQYVEKVKIIKEIQELKNMKVDGEIFKTAVNYAIKILQSLLGKE